MNKGGNTFLFALRDIRILIRNSKLQISVLPSRILRVKILGNGPFKIHQIEPVGSHAKLIIFFTAIQFLLSVFRL